LGLKDPGKMLGSLLRLHGDILDHLVLRTEAVVSRVMRHSII
jgi:hypothetical protein